MTRRPLIALRDAVDIPSVAQVVDDPQQRGRDIETDQIAHRIV